MKKMNYLDLFSGIGGFHLGLLEAGFKFNWCGYSEIDKYAKQIYQKHFPESKDLGDVRTIGLDRLPKIDLITFGFPCQDISLAGKRGGLSGSRSGLFFEAMRIIKNLRPKYFIWENVKGLLSSNNGEDINIIENEMYINGYLFDYNIQNTKWYLPQNRERIYCIGVDILWIGKLLLEEVKNGKKEEMTLFENFIKGYLLSKLQKNLGEQQKLQDHILTGLELDWVISKSLKMNGQQRKLQYLKIILELQLENLKFYYQIIQEMLLQQKDLNLDLFINLNQNLYNMDIILDMKKDQLLELIEKLWKNISEENLIQLNKYIIKIIINLTIQSKSFTFAEIENITWLYIDRLKVLYPDLWNLILLDLMMKSENMKYAKNRKNKNQNTEQKNSFLFPISSIFTKSNEFIGHLRGECRPEIFPIGDSNQIFKTKNECQWLSENGEGIAYALDATYYKGVAQQARTMIQINKNAIQEQKVYNPKEKIDFYVMKWQRSEKGKKIRKQNQKSGKDYTPFSNDCRKLIEKKENIIGTITNALNKDTLIKIGNKNPSGNGQSGNIYDINGISPTITSGGNNPNRNRDIGPNFGYIKDDLNIRRLTPIECERLQGFPDNWTKKGINGNIISDTQRYKCLGNAVSIPVVKEIGIRLLKCLI